MKKDKMSLDLQVHLFLDKYGPEKVIRAMNRTNLDAIAIERYNHETDNFSEFIKHDKDMKNKGYDMEYDDSLIKVRDKRDNKEYFGFKAQEISTSDDYHVLVYGTNSLTPVQPIRKTIDTALEKNHLVAIDHGFVDVRTMTKPISKEKSAELEQLCKDYSGKIALEWNGYCINWIWNLISTYYKTFKGNGVNVNKAVLELSEKLKKEGYDAPVFSDLDGHFRNTLALRELGKTKIFIPKEDLDISSGSKFNNSLKKVILSEKHENYEHQSNIFHFGVYFAIPQLSRKISKNLYDRVRG